MRSVQKHGRLAGVKDESKHALVALQEQLGTAMHLFDESMVGMSDSEREQFRLSNPGAHFVIGDFEIKCLCPEKYHLPNGDDEYQQTQW